MISMILLSIFTYEFPTLLGGIIGSAVTAVLVTFRIGLKDVDPDDMGEEWQMINKKGSLYLAFLEGNKQSISETAESNVNLAESKLEMENPEYQPSDSTSRRLSFASFTSHISAVTSAITTATAVKSAFAKDAEVDDQGSVLEESEIERLTFTDDREDDAPVFELKPRERGMKYVLAMLGRTLPITGTVALLITTRLPMIPLKELLTATETYAGVQLGTFMWFQISPNLVMLFQKILTDDTVNSKYETLYIPGLIPFFVISWLACMVYWKDMRSMRTNPFSEILSLARRVTGAAVALLGGLMLVGLIRNGGYYSPAYLLGSIISGWVEEFWIIIAPFLGALGSFFSGSTAVSNLTFGEVQYVAAVSAGYNPTTILALQVFGASMGNAICINNVIAARTVMGVTEIGEGKFIAKTGPVVIIGISWTTLFMYLCFVLPGQFSMF
ncbi:hypothetical protein SARC_02031 [Sphaeroforma arctica JP610]|uniref:L-lactate permease n=1 Tax=Sphaeroforma arctica JP610 TaxID=667725 RepID=A0A0L0GA99_9EUKA|nr:hypothetical protein SARC_02031 [Sphaeroforma arctica JP610]KNC85806.1 hypothetical protein SARC_02031 [Sphaeroforma arctica JP610]|eukprot:XP_014159708.1 hypothetical protein SARC_02031 [Sphaeroforma arctica JP610]